MSSNAQLAYSVIMAAGGAGIIIARFVQTRGHPLAIRVASYWGTLFLVLGMGLTLFSLHLRAFPSQEAQWVFLPPALTILGAILVRWVRRQPDQRDH